VNQSEHIIHMPALFLENFRELQFVQRGQALYQSRWTLVHECKRILLNRKCGLSAYHLVGHGLCISKARPAELHGFPEDVILEDVALGFRASVRGCKPLLLRTLMRVTRRDRSAKEFGNAIAGQVAYSSNRFWGISRATLGIEPLSKSIDLIVCSCGSPPPAMTAFRSLPTGL
jgi:hypothetical protein